MTHIQTPKLFAVALVSILTGLHAADANIFNPLRQSWPGDLTYLVLNDAQARSVRSLTVSGHTRPVQLETVTRNGRTEHRGWFFATLDEQEDYQDERGRNQRGPRRNYPVSFHTQSPNPGITRREGSEYHLIQNGVYEFRLRRSQSFPEPLPLKDAPHWFAGARVLGQTAWDGRAWFDGVAPVRSVDVEILQEGPVFIDVAVTYHFVAETDGTAEAGPFGVHHYWISWGNPVDTPDLPLFTERDRMPVDRIIHRHLLGMVKHPVGSPFTDYLVVREETQSKEAQAVNIHLLARDIRVEGNTIHATGQHEMDMVLYVAHAIDLEVDVRHWSYYDSWMYGPGDEYTIRPGETQEQWAARMNQLKRQHNARSIPLPGWSPPWRGRNPSEEHKAWSRLIRETDGQALIPPPGWTGPWMFGEYQKWIRLNTAPGTPVLWVLYPYPRGTPAPTFTPLADGTGVRVTLNGVSEEIYLSTQPREGIQGQAVINRGGQQRVLLQPGTVPALGTIRNQPLTSTRSP